MSGDGPHRALAAKAQHDRRGPPLNPKPKEVFGVIKGPGFAGASAADRVEGRMYNYWLQEGGCDVVALLRKHMSATYDKYAGVMAGGQPQQQQQQQQQQQAAAVDSSDDDVQLVHDTADDVNQA